MSPLVNKQSEADGVSGKEVYNCQSVPQVSDVNLACRKAEEAASRRYIAASWLQKIVGPLDLSNEPSEEDLRLCLRNGLVLCSLINKLQPGAVPKIVENSTLSNPLEGPALSAYQHFENVRNFLVAVEDMKLPSFEASDLEKGSMVVTGSMGKVVDCILAIKSYYEWKQNGGHGFWKFGCLKSPCALIRNSSSRSVLGLSSGADEKMEPLTNSTKKINSQHHSSWNLGSVKNLSEEFASSTSAGRVSQVQLHDLPHAMDNSENSYPRLEFASGWLQQITQKFPDIFQHSIGQIPSSDTPGIMTRGENDASQSLLKLVITLLQGKEPEEIPVLVEFMLHRIMEEYEKRLSNQVERLNKTVNLVGHEERVQDHFKSVLRMEMSEKDGSEALIKSLGSKDKNYEYQSKIQALKLELRRIRHLDQKHQLQLESQRSELEELKDTLEITRSDVVTVQHDWEEKLRNLDRYIQSLDHVAEGYHKVAAENRELYNELQDLKGKIRVYCRVRPFLPSQTKNQSTVISIGENDSITIMNPTKQGKDSQKSFKFNKVFGPSASQEKIFFDMQPLIRSVLDGYNVCILAYGQTGSGKTHTMSGPNNGRPQDWGVNLRSLHDLFEICQKRSALMNYEVAVQMVEIYNEQVRDLLCDDNISKKLEIWNNSQQQGLHVPDAIMVSVNSTADVLDVMSAGHRNRAFGTTAMNERSSRSHSVLIVHVQGKDVTWGSVLRGCLHLVDLAGSERVDRSEAAGERLKEAQHINRSLSALGDVISSLAHKTSHIPYRNSKLTQLLQHALGGQAKTLMFVHISPDEGSCSETLSTLKFAQRVATVELGASQSTKEIKEIQQLKGQISALKETIAKKDTELVQLLKAKRAKSYENGSGKGRLKQGISPRGSTADINDTSHKNCRQPLEEMRNAEMMRQSHMSGGSVRMMLGHNSDIPDIYEEAFEQLTQNKLAINRSSPSPEVVDSTTTTFGLHNPLMTLKNKVGYSEPFQDHHRNDSERMRWKLKKERAVDHASSSEAGMVNDHDEYMSNKAGREFRAALEEMLNAATRGDDDDDHDISTSAMCNPYMEKEAASKTWLEMKRDWSSQIKLSYACDSGASQQCRDCSTEESSKRREEIEEKEVEVEEEEGTSEVETCTPHRLYSTPEKSTKSRKQQQNSVSLNQTATRRWGANNAHMTDGEKKVVGNHSSHGSQSKRYSVVVGSSSFGGAEGAGSGLKLPTTLETKLVARSSEGASVECYAKTILPRPPAQGTSSSKVVKRGSEGKGKKGRI